MLYFNADHSHAHPPTSQVQALKKSHAVGKTSAGATTSHSAITLKSVGPPPVKQRTPAASAARSAAASGSTLKAKVPPPVPPRGSPRKRDSDAFQQHQLQEGGGSSRALSTTPGIETRTKLKKHKTKEKRPLSSHNDNKNANANENDNGYDNDTTTKLQVPTEDMPRFGEKRSPSNVRDWLELHDLFEGLGDSPQTGKTSQAAPPLPPSPQIAALQNLRRKDSVRSITSSTYSAARSRISHNRPLNHVDMFHRQNHMMAGRRPSVATSIVYNFPPLPSEHSDRSSGPLKHRSREERESRALKKREKHMQYLNYADMALAADNCEPYEDNLLQSMHAFIEVKQDLEKSRKARKMRPNLIKPETDDNHSISMASSTDLYAAANYNYNDVKDYDNDDVDDGGGNPSHRLRGDKIKMKTVANANPKTKSKTKAKTKKKQESHTKKSKNTPSNTATNAFSSDYILDPPFSSRRSSFVEL